MQGDVRALFGPGQELAMFYCSSGTTGVSKYIPMTKTGFKEQYLKVVGCVYGFIGKYYFPRNLYKVAIFPCAPRWRYTSTGVKIGPSSAHQLSSEVLVCQYTVPLEANIIRKEAEAMHVAFVLALRDRDVYFWEAGFAFSLWNQLQFLERNWPVIVNDIRCGKLSPALDITEEQRKAIDSLLSPDTERAAELQKEFERGFDGIVPRVLPNVHMVTALSSGTSMAVYSERCKKYLGHLHIASAVYAASEGVIGVNVNEPGKQPEYALAPEANFVEFLPVDESGEAEEGATPLLASEVKMDQLYEVVLTNATGLYRYRMGDVVRVVGSYHGTPTVDFQFRAKQMLNVHMEKVSEAAFTGALRRAVDGWPDHQLVDFTTAESVLDPAAASGRSADSAGSPPYYLVLLELSGPLLPSQQTADIDATLQQEHFVYRSFRVKSSIGVVALLMTVAVDLALLPRSRFHTWRSLALMYLVRRYCQLVGWYNWMKVSAKYSDLRGAQERFVLKVVKTHADSEYGRHHSFADIRSLEDFRRLHPVTDYSHYKSYIERAMQGDVRALFGPGQELAMFCCSSGTTGVSKYIPMTKTGFKEQYLKVGESGAS
ncbi:GH3 domain-containing protein [Amphibalanus amphitrite]|uniref:GH3 domain-containing protein n=1 Tax=Amphibalanus amphitrite TaxID=1232801 RepID=A0A6A4WU86_AMPAM|nr:GH3 domain-containing protein [Amphibalanus amphitrite]